MTVVVTNDVASRTRGFLASCMLEVAPGVYTSPKLTAAVRERIWTVLVEWHGRWPGGSVLMTWPDAAAQGGQALRVIGLPQKLLVDHDGVILACRPRVSEDA